MNTKTITIIATTLLAAISCIGIQEKDVATSPGGDCLLVDFPDVDTRVYVDGVRTLLHSEDMFSVFRQSSTNEQWIYIGEDGTTNGMLTQNEAGGSATEFTQTYSVYPWNKTASISNGIITTVLPEVQYFKENSFGRGSAVLAAVTNSNSLRFKYASGFVCLTLKGDADIQDITLTTQGGEPIAGAVNIDMNGDRPDLQAEGTPSVLLRNLDMSPMDVKGSENFIFSAAPGTYENGIAFSVRYTTGQVQKVIVSGPYTIKTGNISSPVETTCQALMTIEANFHTDGQSVINPFSTSITRDIIPGNTGSTSESGDIFLTSDTDQKYPFRFYIANKDSADNLRITRSGLNFGKTIGDYIKFPGVEGMKLTAVQLMSSTTCSVSINSQEEVTLPSLMPVVISITGAEEGQACKMEMRSTQAAKFYNITLYYDIAS